MASGVLDNISTRLNSIANQLSGLITNVSDQVQSGTIKISPSLNTGQRIVIAVFLALLLGIILAIIYNRAGVPTPLWIGVAVIALAVIIFVVLQMGK